MYKITLINDLNIGLGLYAVQVVGNVSVEGEAFGEVC